MHGVVEQFVADRLQHPTDLDRFWDVVTSSEDIVQWMLPVRSKRRLGGRYQLVGNAERTITACDPPRSFDATWEHVGV